MKENIIIHKMKNVRGSLFKKPFTPSEPFAFDTTLICNQNTGIVVYKQ